MPTWFLLASLLFSVLDAQKCDDGNTKPGDGCNGTLIESFDWSCPLKGACKCTCIDPKDPKKCGCNWYSSQAPVPVHRVSYFDRLAVELKDGSGVLMKGLRFTANEQEEMALEAATVPTTGIDWDESKMQVVQWYGSPMRFLNNLDRVAFECPPETVPTKLLFKRAGCNMQNVNALRDKKNRRTAPPCLASDQGFNEGLSLVAECRPNPALIDSAWKWVDAGIGAPIVSLSEMDRLGGVCETGYAMTGIHFKRWGCNANVWWNQLVTRDTLAGRCALNATGVDEKSLTEGLIVRVKCTRFSENNFQECGAETPCGANAKCATHPTYGSRCVCAAGYRLGDGHACQAINPCEGGPCAKSQEVAKRTAAPTPTPTPTSTPTPVPTPTPTSTPTPTPGRPTTAGDGIRPAPNQHVIPGTGRRDINDTSGIIADLDARKHNEQDDLSTGEVAGIVVGSLFGASLLLGAALFAVGGVSGGGGVPTATGDYVAL